MPTPDLPPPTSDAERLDFEQPPGAPTRDEPSTAAMMPTPSRSRVFQFSEINLEKSIVAKGYGSVTVFNGLLLEISHSGIRGKLSLRKGQAIWKEPAALLKGWASQVTVDPLGAAQTRAA